MTETGQLDDNQMKAQGRTVSASAVFVRWGSLKIIGYLKRGPADIYRVGGKMQNKCPNVNSLRHEGYNCKVCYPENWRHHILHTEDGIDDCVDDCQGCVAVKLIEAELDLKDQQSTALELEVERLEAALKVIVMGDEKYTAEQIAKHALRLEPLQP